MFTTIAKLRSSSAQQNRVTQVFTALKKRYPGFTEEQAFPIIFIVISNSVADYGWVMDHTATHVKPAGWIAPVLADWKKQFKALTESPTRVEAEASLNSIDETAKKYDLKYPVYGKDGAVPSVPAIAAAGANTPTANFTGVTKAPAKKVVAKKGPAKKDPAAMAVRSTPLDRKLEPKNPPTKKVAPRVLPVPSVIAQIIKLVKGHPRFDLVDTKGTPRNLSITVK